MLYNSLCVCLLVLCVIGCSTDSTDDESIFPVPPIISEEEQEVTPPGIPVEIVPPPVPQPIVKDLTAPKLLESTVDSGRVDPNTDVISLRFNEDIIEIDIKLVDNSDVSLRWIPSIDLITGRRIFLTRINGRVLGSDRKYYIKGFVEDKDGNKTSIDIEFRAVEENRDRIAPSILTSSVNHGASNVSINIDQFVFTFNEEIDEAELSLVRGEWNTGTDMRWTRFIDKKKVVLLKITGKSLSLRNNETYNLVLKARDESGNWTPAGNQVWVYEFTTQR
ncbi:MAG: Ig-like domain-containing protein [Candidatus Poribacteria bacterium]|nr:Ig-like domain-containing protein [Candidatus Poribacteria bacterium]